MHEHICLMKIVKCNENLEFYIVYHNTTQVAYLGYNSLDGGCRAVYTNSVY